METTQLQTSNVEMVEFSDFSTVGELKSILNKFPDKMGFVFRNQPLQDLFHIKYKDSKYEWLCFQEPQKSMECKFNPDSPIVVKIAKEIRIQFITSNPLKNPELLDREMRGYICEMLNGISF